MKPILALLLIVTLLACPLRCLSFHAGIVIEQTSAVESTACCESCCCRAEGESPAPDRPVPCHPGDCDCQDCICQGAVVEADVELPATRVVWCGGRQDGAAYQAASVSSFCPAEYLPDAFNPFSSGRAARIGLQSLLI
ncbi:hypothetical protein [Novipirellula artificiosorum]|uniref:hypothetical protein n=1 Tax=Novipirellula artificiosorum TaxID=2528016 RepID=UPI0011B49141|nr:hypothetical protein [Novipirellula artificiosorum]